MEAFALRFGAKCEAGCWYVDGDVPNELRGLVINGETSPVIQALLAHVKVTPSEEAAPLCPACGRGMYRRENTKAGGSFWGCSGFPNCRKTLPVDVHGRIESSPADSQLARAMEATIRFSMEKLGTRASRWMSLPKVGLKGKTPYDAMATIEGCREVYALIRLIADSS